MYTVSEILTYLFFIVKCYLKQVVHALEMEFKFIAVLLLMSDVRDIVYTVFIRSNTSRPLLTIILFVSESGHVDILSFHVLGDMYGLHL